jgi:hypothetical protein
MDLPLLMVLLVLVAAALFILPPLLRGDADAGSHRADPALAALAEAASRRDSTYEALADLEFDHASGKVATDEFGALKTQYQTAAMAALKDLEGLQGKSPADPVDAKDGTGTS